MKLEDIPPRCLEFVMAVDTDLVWGTDIETLPLQLQHPDILRFCIGHDLVYHAPRQSASDVRRGACVRTSCKGRALVSEWRLTKSSKAQRRRLLKKQGPLPKRPVGLDKPVPPVRSLEPSNPTERSIVDTLRKVGRRMVGDELLKAARGGSINGFGKATLAKLCVVGILSNRRDEHGKGYGLVEWDEK